MTNKKSNTLIFGLEQLETSLKAIATEPAIQNPEVFVRFLNGY